MSNINHLEEVMSAEAELTERLVEVMSEQMTALVNVDSATVEATTERQQELLLPIEGLEHERMRLTREVWKDFSKQDVEDSTLINLSSLMSCLKGDDASRISNIGSRLHTAVEQMVKLNQANQFLIDHSRKFVRETFRIVTNGFSRQLVDQKM